MVQTTAPQVGDDIYVRTALYIDRGYHDVMGGLARVTEVSTGISAGKEVPFVQVFEHPRHSYNWEYLVTQQDKLREEFDERRAYPDPDMGDRPPRLDTTKNHRSAAEALTYFTDCQLATYDVISDRTRTSKSELSRQRSICEKMIEACSRYGADPRLVAKLIQRMNHR